MYVITFFSSINHRRSVLHVGVSTNISNTESKSFQPIDCANSAILCLSYSIPSTTFSVPKGPLRHSWSSMALTMSQPNRYSLKPLSLAFNATCKLIYLLIIFSLFFQFFNNRICIFHSQLCVFFSAIKCCLDNQSLHRLYRRIYADFIPINRRPVICDNDVASTDFTYTLIRHLAKI